MGPQRPVPPNLAYTLRPRQRTPRNEERRRFCQASPQPIWQLCSPATPKLWMFICRSLTEMSSSTDTRSKFTVTASLSTATGGYASVTHEGMLKLYWGESKIYKDAATAIKDCLASVAPFLIEPEHEDAGRERDLILLSDKADLSDPALTEALKRYFDKMSPMSKRVKYCAVALVGFDAAFYPGDRAQAIADEMKEAARIELKKWSSTIGTRLKKEKLEQVEVELFCLPLPSAEDFRAAFLKAMGQTV
ncbi:hypothetical protein ABIF44_004815 [Bradyrhizobium japonicum]|nr:hypothetical protein [Bradyrhizobium japonicum]